MRDFTVTFWKKNKIAQLTVLMERYWWLLIFVGLLLINRFYWPTPDEYFYAVVVRTIKEGWQGRICLSCIDTLHTPGLVVITALWQLLVRQDTILWSRIFPIISGVVTLIYMEKILRISFGKSKTYLLILIGLVPGFMYFTLKLLIDIPALMFSTILLYGILLNKNKTIISIALVGMLLFRDYSYWLALIINIFCLIYLDLFLDKKKFIKKIIILLSDLVVTILPSLLLLAYLLTSNNIPYPSMLENEYKQEVSLINNVVEKSLRIFGKNAINVDGQSEFYIVNNSIGDIITGNVGIIGTVARTLNSLKEVYINILVIPLILLGFTKSFKKLNKRTGVVILIFLIINLLFIFRASTVDLGFRIILGLLPVFVWYGRIGLDHLLKGNNRVFITILLLIVSPWFLFNELNGKELSPFLLYRNIYFLGLAWLLLTLVFVTKNIKYRKFLIIAYSLIVVVSHSIPTIVKSYFDEKVYGYDYIKIKNIDLNKIFESKKKIYTNVNPVVLMYYGGGLWLNNSNSFPSFRDIKEKHGANIFKYLENVDDLKGSYFVWLDYGPNLNKKELERILDNKSITKLNTNSNEIQIYYFE